MRFSIFFLLFLSGCSIFFGGNDGPKSAKGSLYTINFNSPGWDFKKDNRSDYVFEHQESGHIILSNSFCDEFQDQPLEQLAERTFRTLANFKPAIHEYTTFQNREAYRMEGNGTVDGVNVGLRLLNTRRNNCYFDFVSILPKRSVGSSDKAFDEFLKTVVFR